MRISRIDWLLRIRAWERAHLPIGNSQLAYEVFLRLALYGSDRQALRSVNLKQIYLSLGYSEFGIRVHLRRLERDGWIQVIDGDGDRRGRQVLLTGKFEELLDRYMALWNGADGGAQGLPSGLPETPSSESSELRSIRRR